MLIPHLHFGGECKNAIGLYEKAFGTNVTSIEYGEDGENIVHATMSIHGQEVFLNDRFGNMGKSLDCAVHLIVTFDTVKELLACYEVLKEDGGGVDVFRETPYSKLCGNFMDKFGVLWGFMAGI